VAREIWPTDEIEVSVSGAFTTHHRVHMATGALGEFTFPTFRTSGVFRATDGRELTVRRTSLWRGQRELREGDAVLCRAWPRGFFGREIVVQFKGQEYALRPAGFWTRSWRLTDGVYRALLEIRPRGVFRRGAYLTVMVLVDADLLVFAYYLVHMRWQEEAAAASAAAAGGS
jgi:hypothetical protein